MTGVTTLSLKLYNQFIRTLPLRLRNYRLGGPTHDDRRKGISRHFILFCWCMVCNQLFITSLWRDDIGTPDCKVHGVHLGPIWGRQDPCWPHVGPTNLAIWDAFRITNFLRGQSTRHLLIPFTKWPIMPTFNASFIVSLNRLVKKHSNCRWIETSCKVNVMCS